MTKQGKHYTPEEKVAILRRHLLEAGAHFEALRRAIIYLKYPDMLG
jgi:hypothetical protein